MREDKVYVLKCFKVGKLTPLRSIDFVIRKKQWYEKYQLSIWWSKDIGIGIIGKPRKQIKYFMIGVTIINIQSWLNFKWIGDRPNKLNNVTKVAMRDE